MRPRWTIRRRRLEREIRATALPEFEMALRRWVEPVVRPAGLTWNSSGFGFDVATGELRALFEGDEMAFGKRFPHVWPGPEDARQAGCVDLWIYYYLDQRQIEATIERPNIAGWLEEHGHRALAETLDSPADIEPAVRALADGLRVMLRVP